MNEENEQSGAPAEMEASEPFDANNPFTLLEQYNDRQAFQPNLDKVMEAIKLADYAKTFYSKKYFSRIQHKVTGPNDDEYKYLFSENADEIINQAKAYPQRFDKTVLANIAAYRLMEALDVDVDAYFRGLQKAGLWEGVHSALGRAAVFFTFALGTGLNIGLKEASKAAEKNGNHKLAGVLKLASKLPKPILQPLAQYIASPIITGLWRIKTNARQDINRDGGAPNLDANFTKPKHINVHYQGIYDADENLGRLLTTLQTELKNSGEISSELRDDIEEELKRAAKVEHGIDLTVAANMQQTRSKGWGAGSNFFAGLTEILIGLAGSIEKNERLSNIFAISGVALYGLSGFTQWAAGFGDKGPAHFYAVKLLTSLGDLWTKAGNDVPIDERMQDTRYLDSAKVKKAWKTLPESKVEAIRDIYKHKLGTITKRIREIEIEEDGNAQGALESAEKEKLGRLKKNLIEQVEKFESFSEDRWRELQVQYLRSKERNESNEKDEGGNQQAENKDEEDENENILWECLTNPTTFLEQLEPARAGKVGEKSSQISQRYFHVLHTVLLSPTAAWAAGVGVNLSDMPEETKEIIVAITKFFGNAVHPAIYTGEARMGKQDNKPFLTAIMDAAKAKADGEKARDDTWKIKTNLMLEDGTPFEIDLTDGGAFDDFIHSYWQQVGRILKIAPENLVGGVKAVYHSLRVFPKHNSAMDKAEKIRALLQTARNVERPFIDAGKAERQDTIKAILEEIKTYSVASNDRMTHSERRARAEDELRATTPKQWAGMPAPDKDPLAVNVRPQVAENNDDPEKNANPVLTSKNTSALSDQQKASNEWEASFQEYIETEKSSLHIDITALHTAIQMLGTGDPNDKSIISMVEKGLGIDQTVADKRNFWNRATSLALDYVPAALSLIPIGLQHGAIEKKWPNQSAGITFATNFVVQLGLIPAIRKRLQDFDDVRENIQHTGGIPNFSDLSENTPSAAEIRAQLDQATTAIQESGNDNDSVNAAFNQAAAAKKNSKRRQAVDEIEGKASAAQDYTNWLINFCYFGSQFAGHFTKNSLYTFTAQLSANVLIGAYSVYNAGKMATQEYRKKLKAVVEFHDCRTEEAIRNGIEIVIWDPEKGRLIPNPVFKPEHIDAIKVRNMWIGYSQLRLESVEEQIDAKIARIDKQIASIKGITTSELYVDRNYQIATTQGPLDQRATNRLKELEARAKTHGMSLQMEQELADMRLGLGSNDPSTLLAERYARFKMLETLEQHSLTQAEWGELEALRARDACRLYDEAVFAAREAWISARIDQQSARADVENQFDIEVGQARGEHAQGLDPAIRDFARGFSDEKANELQGIQQKLTAKNPSTAEQITLHEVEAERDRLNADKIKLHNDWPNLGNETKETLDRALKGGFWRDIATAWQTSSYKQESIFDKLSGAYGNNNRFLSVISHGFPLLADSSLMLWEAMVNRHAPENCKEPLKQAGTTIVQAVQTYQLITAMQSAASPSPTQDKEKRQETIAGPAGTIIAGSDGVTLIGPGGTIIVNPTRTELHGGGGTLIFPTPKSTSTLSTSITSDRPSVSSAVTTTDHLSTPSSISLTSNPSTSVSQTSLSGSLATPTSTSIPSPPTSGPTCPPSTPPEHKDIPLAARIVITGVVALAAGALGSRNKQLKNSLTTLWTGIKRAESDLESAEQDLRRRLRSSSSTKKKDKQIVAVDPDDELPPNRDLKQKVTTASTNQDDILPDTRPSQPERELQNFGIEEIPREQPSSQGYLGQLRNLVWTSKPAPTPKRITEEIISFAGTDRDYINLLKEEVKDSNFRMPITTAPAKEIVDKEAFEYQWLYTSNNVVYFDAMPLSATQTRDLSVLNDLANLLPIHGKEVRDSYLEKIRVDALQHWYDKHVSSESLLKIERHKNPQAEEAGHIEEEVTEILECRDIYLAAENYLDVLVKTNSEKKDIATLKFSLIYREFQSMANGESTLSSQNFKQFLLCYFDAEQKTLQTKMRASWKRDIKAKTLESQISRFSKLERIKDLFLSEGLVSPSPNSETQKNYEDAYHQLAVIEQAVDQNVDVSAKFKEFVSNLQSSENTSSISADQINTALLLRCQQCIQQAAADNVRTTLVTIKNQLSAKVSQTIQESDIPPGLQHGSITRSDSGIDVDDELNEPTELVQQSSSITQSDIPKISPVKRSDSATTHDSGFNEETNEPSDSEQEASPSIGDDAFDIPSMIRRKSNFSDDSGIVVDHPFGQSRQPESVVAPAISKSELNRSIGITQELRTDITTESLAETPSENTTSISTSPTMRETTAVNIPPIPRGEMEDKFALGPALESKDEGEIIAAEFSSAFYDGDVKGWDASLFDEKETKTPAAFAGDDSEQAELDAFQESSTVFEQLQRFHRDLSKDDETASVSSAQSAEENDSLLDSHGAEEDLESSLTAPESSLDQDTTRLLSAETTEQEDLLINRQKGTSRKKKAAQLLPSLDDQLTTIETSLSKEAAEETVNVPILFKSLPQSELDGDSTQIAEPLLASGAAADFDKTPDVRLNLPVPPSKLEKIVEAAKANAKASWTPKEKPIEWTHLTRDYLQAVPVMALQEMLDLIKETAPNPDIANQLGILLKSKEDATYKLSAADVETQLALVSAFAKIGRDYGTKVASQENAPALPASLRKSFASISETAQALAKVNPAMVKVQEEFDAHLRIDTFLPPLPLSADLAGPLIPVSTSLLERTAHSTIDVVTTSIPPDDGSNLKPKGVCANSGLRYALEKAKAALFPMKPKTELKKYLPGEKAAFAKKFEGQRLSSKDLKVLTAQDRISAGWEPIGQRKDGSVLFRVEGGGAVKGAILPAPLVKALNIQFTLGEKLKAAIKIGDQIGKQQTKIDTVGSSVKNTKKRKT